MSRLSTLAALAVLVLLAVPARAHDWFDYDCCSDHDCKVVPDGTIAELADGSGWKVQGFPEVVGRKDPRARPTKSGQEAVCSGSLTLRCIYYRPSSM
jgi:hypothetical protein